MKPRILLIYTGGTIGMMEDPSSRQLRPFDFSSLSNQIPELNKLDIQLEAVAFAKPIDSSNMNPQIWAEMATSVYNRYDEFDGFVILHGSDTMAYTASALSFMLENLNKPVILTGSQLPIGTIRTDGKENIITAMEIAAAGKRENISIPEVCIYFEFSLHRGNRTTKISASHFNAFHSGNYPLLAEAGVTIKYNLQSIRKIPNQKLQLHVKMDNQVAILKLFPGISREVVSAVLSNASVKGIVLETFGSGNGPTDAFLIDEIKKSIAAGKIVVNVTQCKSGTVIQGKYETSAHFKEAGVISGNDMTTEAALTKLMHLLGRGFDQKKIAVAFATDFCGEISL
ncbi:MAG: asparaginase [Flavobacteriales bacterium]